MKKKLIILFFALYTLCSDGQSFDYVGAAQTYWKYRYRLVGDYIQSDSMGWGGEPGFLIRGELSGPEASYGCGLSSPARYRMEYIAYPHPIGGNNDNSGDNYNCLFNPSASCNGANQCANQPNFTGLWTPGILNWNDGQGDDLSKYLAVLATEWKLLNHNHESTAKTELELYYALKTFNRLEEYAYVEFGKSPEQNGLFFRDDVPANITRTLTNSPGLPAGTPYKNFGSQYNNVASYGSCTEYGCGNGSNPGLMSKDQAINMLWGLAFVVHSVPPGVYGSDWGPYTIHDHNYELYYQAQAAMGRIISWMSGNTALGGLPLGIFEIVDPNLGPVCQGEGAQGESFGLVTTGRNFAGWPPFPSPTPASNIISTLDGPVWNSLYEFNMLIYNNLSLFGNTSFETLLTILAGPRVPLSPYTVFGDVIDALCFCHSGSTLMTHRWSHGIFNQGLNLNFPYLDMAAAYLWVYRPYGSQRFVQNLLTQLPIDATHPYNSNNQASPYPCYMPLMDYTIVGQESSDHGFQNATDIPIGEQMNGLDYMLFYNLYCIHYGGSYQPGGAKYLDVAEAKMTAFSDLQDRVVTATYPIDLNSVGAPHVPSYRYLGTAANPLTTNPVGAETSMLFQGATANSGAYVAFLAPHLGAPYNTQGAYAANANFWAKYGSVVTLNNGRPACNSAIIPGTTTEYKLLPEDTVDETPYQQLIDSLTTAYKNGTLQYTDDSTLQDVSYTLNIYPNPFSSECKIDLTLSTSAAVSMELYDVYGRDIFTVLSESQLGDGEHNYLIDRGDLVTGAYMLVIYVNNKRFVRKLSVI